MNEPQETTLNNSTGAPGLVISGKLLVTGLFVFGGLLTLLMFVYWDLHTRPFRPLRTELRQHFQKMRPVVEGGRSKGKGPWTLRITLTVDFPPNEDVKKSDQLAEQIRESVRLRAGLPQMEQLEFTLIHFIPQQIAQTKTYTWTAAEVRAEPAK